VKSTAEQAFLETVIFKLDIDRTMPRINHWSSDLASFTETSGTRLRYLNLKTAIMGFYDSPVEEYELDFSWCRMAVTYMETLKRCFPNLKACVLTLDIRINAGRTPPGQPFDQTRLLQGTSMDQELGPTLGSEAARVFDAFVAKGPGKSQFVRMRYFPGGSQSMETGEELRYWPLYYGSLVKVDREKMAAESQNESFGAQLFKEAYRPARAGRQSP